MDLPEIEGELNRMLADRSLEEAENLMGRVEALDLLNFVEQLVAVRGRQSGKDQRAARLQAQVEGLRDRLNALNEREVEAVRATIQAGQTSPQSLRERLDHYLAYSTEVVGPDYIGYDGLDVLTQSLFRLQTQEVIYKLPDSDMVHYEPTPTWAVLELLDQVQPGPADIFYDLGSGLGNVALLVALLSPAQVCGVEFERRYCHHARQLAAELGLTTVNFINADVRHVDLSAGTIFFMFTPFKGKIMRTVLERLARTAAARPLTICSYGTSTHTLAEQPWLQITDPAADNEYRLAVFKSGMGV